MPCPLNRSTGVGAACLLVALLGCLGAQAEPQPKALRLLKRTPLPQASSVATDVRWASDDSVYVSWDHDGVAEVGLDGARRRVLVPGLTAFGGLSHFTHLAVSPSALTVASMLHSLAWRPLKATPKGEVLFQRQQVAITEDLDLSGDRVLLLGLAKHQSGERTIAPDGAVAWVGTLSARLEDLKPVLYDLGGPGAPNYYNCRAHPIGAVRFLADGSFVVAPGFQDGVHLYNAGARRVRSWTNEQAGLDTHLDCPKITDEQRQFVNDAGWPHFLNSHHVVDDILPLPQGPGLLIRSWGADGQVHWTLKVLQAGG